VATAEIGATIGINLPGAPAWVARCR